jgi:hypothetical protein
MSAAATCGSSASGPRKPFSPNWSPTLNQKSEIELKRAALAKTIRTVERLRASIAADRAINERLPRTLKEFDEAVARGELRTPDLDALEAEVGL